MPLFDKYNVDLVMSGHSHVYQRGHNAPKIFRRKTFDRKNNLNKQSTTYIISGGGGGELEVPNINHVENYKFYEITTFQHHYIHLKVKQCKSKSDMFIFEQKMNLCRLEVVALNPFSETIVDHFILYPQGEHPTKEKNR